MCGTYKIVVWLSYKIKVIKMFRMIKKNYTMMFLLVNSKSLFLKINCPLLVLELNTIGLSYKYVLIDTVGTPHPTIFIDRTDDKFWRRS